MITDMLNVFVGILVYGFMLVELMRIVYIQLGYIFDVIFIVSSI